MIIGQAIKRIDADDDIVLAGHVLHGPDLEMFFRHLRKRAEMPASNLDKSAGDIEAVIIDLQAATTKGPIEITGGATRVHEGVTRLDKWNQNFGRLLVADHLLGLAQCPFQV